MNADAHVLTRILDASGEALQLRLMTAADRDAVLAFARALPEHDLLFLRRDITQPKVVDAWIRELDSGAGFVSVLACRGETVVGCSSLVRDPLSWSAHLGEIRLVIAESVRGKGVGVALAQEAFVLGLRAGCESLFAQMTVDQTGAIAIFEGLGFTPEAMLRDHVKDRAGQTFDVVVLSHHVARQQAKLAAYGLTEAH